MKDINIQTIDKIEVIFLNVLKVFFLKRNQIKIMMSTNSMLLVYFVLKFEDTASKKTSHHDDQYTINMYCNKEWLYI